MTAGMISVTVDDAQVLSLLKQISQRCSNMQPAMAEVGQELAERVRQGFSNSTSPYGDKWSALSAVTQAMRKGKRASGQPLLDTGRLRNSISSSASATSASATSATVGTNVIYAGTHQYGAKQGQYGKTKRNGPVPYGNVPARPFLPIQGARAVLPQDWKASVLEILQDHVLAGQGR